MIVGVIVGGCCLIAVVAAGVVVFLLTDGNRDPFDWDSGRYGQDLRGPQDSADDWTGPLRTHSPSEVDAAHLETLGHVLPFQKLTQGQASKLAKRLRRQTLKVRGWQRPRHAQQGLPRPAAPPPPLPPQDRPLPELHAAPVAEDVEVADGTLAEAHARALDALAWLDTPLPGDQQARAASDIYPDWHADDSGIMRAIRGEAV